MAKGFIGRCHTWQKKRIPCCQSPSFHRYAICFEMACGCDSPLGVSCLLWPLSSHHSSPKQFTHKSVSQEQWLGPQTIQQNLGLAGECHRHTHTHTHTSLAQWITRFSLSQSSTAPLISHDSILIIRLIEFDSSPDLGLGTSTDFPVWFHSDSHSHDLIWFSSDLIWFDARN